MNTGYSGEGWDGPCDRDSFSFLSFILVSRNAFRNFLLLHSKKYQIGDAFNVPTYLLLGDFK